MTNPLAGKPLGYLIGADADDIVIAHDAVTVLPYDYDKSIHNALAVGYGNLFWQKGAPDCTPYLDDTDTAEEYGERVIDPRGFGWLKNLDWQFTRWKKLGVGCVELDNPDAYEISDIIGAIDLANRYSLRVIAKNPELMKAGAPSYLAHPNICGAIVEKDCGGAQDMDGLRRLVGKPDLPVWFVAFGSGKLWARSVAATIIAHDFRNMGVTYCDHGEYERVKDVLVPIGAQS